MRHGCSTHLTIAQGGRLIARCACGNSTCSCVVKGGDGIIVTGNGTSTRPFLVAQESGGQLKNLIQVTDTPTLDLVISGDGTVGNKLDIRGNTLTKMTDLKDVADPEGPAAGDVPVWMGTHWEFRPPTSAPPGSVSAGAGLTGDGSSGNPLKVKFSGIWPLTNFDPTQDGLTGNEVYLDPAGNLRARPGVLTVAKLVTDLPAAYPIGTTVMAVDATAGAAWPAAAACTVVTHRQSGAVAAQWCYLNSPTTTQAWYRNGSTAWAAWRQVINPALPAPVFKVSTVDYSAALNPPSGNVEINSVMRCTIVNPSTTRRMLVTAKSYGQLQITGATGGVACYSQTLLVSGAPVDALPKGENRIGTATGAVSATFSVFTEWKFWVPAGATVVTTTGARRTAANGVVRAGYVESLTPERFE
jgi:hypothetical protein